MIRLINIVFATIFLFPSIKIYSQSCIVANLTFSSQEQIDSFLIDSGGCTVIVGNVSISEDVGENITNLSGLSHIKSIRGHLQIHGNKRLKNLNDLAALDSIYGLFLSEGNDSLVSITGINDLDYLGGGLWIEEDNLTELGEFPQFDTLELINLFIPGVKELNAFPNLRVAHEIFLKENKLVDLSAFNSLERAFALLIFRSDSLVSLHGLENVTSLNYLIILDNPLLSELTGLDNLEVIYDAFTLGKNPNLQSIVALAGIHSNSLSDIAIYENPVLALCDYDFICEAFSRPDITHEIHDNAPGCNSFLELAINCQIQCPGNYQFYTQADVDRFSVDFPNCTFVPGNIIIRNGSMTDLDSLYLLKGIGGSVVISNTKLNSLLGLRNVDTIGLDLEISKNDSLTNLDGLEGITNIRILEIVGNERMVDMSGLTNLREVGLIALENQPVVNGLNSLRTVWGEFIVTGDEVDLLEFTFPPLLDTIHVILTLANIHSIPIFPDAPKLKHTGGLSIINTDLKSFNGLSGLATIDGDLQIFDNPLLESLEGLGSLREIHRRIAIERNASIVSLGPLSEINPDLLSTYWDLPVIAITDNESLETCAIEPVCAALSDPERVVLIEGNETGCMNNEVVLNECIVSTSHTFNLSDIHISPNPTYGKLNIEVVPDAELEIHQVSIYDPLGSLVFSEKFIPTISLNGRPGGIYTIVLSTHDGQFMSTRILLMQ